MQAIRTPLAFSLLAILSIAASQEAAASASQVSKGLALEAGRDSQDCAAPIPADSFVSAAGASLYPGLTGVPGTPTGLVSEFFLDPRGASELERRADLIAALILTKYSHFRESLTSP